MVLLSFLTSNSSNVQIGLHWVFLELSISRAVPRLARCELMLQPAHVGGQPAPSRSPGPAPTVTVLREGQPNGRTHTICKLRDGLGYFPAEPCRPLRRNRRRRLRWHLRISRLSRCRSPPPCRISSRIGHSDTKSSRASSCYRELRIAIAPQGRF